MSAINMEAKQSYTTPNIKVINMITDDNIAQFVITSKSVPENSGDAKGGYFCEEEEEEIYPNN